MKRFPILLLLVSAAMILNSCSKKDDDPSNREMLTGKYWINTSMTIDPAINIGGTNISNLWTLMLDCEKDNLVKFDDNGVYIEDEGSTKCDPGDPQTQTGTWAFNADETVISTTMNGETFSVTLDQLSSSSFKGHYTETIDFGSGPLPYTITFTAVVK